MKTRLLKSLLLAAAAIGIAAPAFADDWHHDRDHDRWHHHRAPVYSYYSPGYVYPPPPVVYAPPPPPPVVAAPSLNIVIPFGGHR